MESASGLVINLSYKKRNRAAGNRCQYMFMRGGFVIETGFGNAHRVPLTPALSRGEREVKSVRDLSPLPREREKGKSVLDLSPLPTGEG